MSLGWFGILVGAVALVVYAAYVYLKRPIDIGHLVFAAGIFVTSLAAEVVDDKWFARRVGVIFLVILCGIAAWATLRGPVVLIRRAPNQGKSESNTSTPEESDKVDGRTREGN